MSSMSKRSTRKIGNVRVTRTESNGRVKTSQSTTFKGSNGFRATHRISKNSKGQDVHHYSTALGNGWVRRETRSPSTGAPKSSKSSTSKSRRSSRSRSSNQDSVLMLGFIISLAILVMTPIVKATKYITANLVKSKETDFVFEQSSFGQKTLYVLLYPLILVTIMTSIILIISLIAHVVQ